jgi:hypothetical protein
LKGCQYEAYSSALVLLLAVSSASAGWARDLGRSVDFISSYLRDNAEHDELKMEPYLFRPEFDVWETIQFRMNQSIQSNYAINDSTHMPFGLVLTYECPSDSDLLSQSFALQKFLLIAVPLA